MGKHRFATLGIDNDAFLHIFQLQFVNKNYAELRSQNKFGHQERNDAEVEHEESEIEQRDNGRDLLMQQLQELLMKPKADPDHNWQLINELETFHQEDQMKKSQLMEIVNQVEQIGADCDKAVNWEQAQVDKRKNHFSQEKDTAQTSKLQKAKMKDS